MFTTDRSSVLSCVVVVTKLVRFLSFVVVKSSADAADALAAQDSCCCCCSASSDVAKHNDLPKHLVAFNYVEMLPLSKLPTSSCNFCIIFCCRFILSKCHLMM